MSIDGLTGHDIEALAARLDGHVKAFPKQSERADVMLAADVLRAIVAIGLPVTVLWLDRKFDRT